MRNMFKRLVLVFIIFSLIVNTVISVIPVSADNEVKESVIVNGNFENEDDPLFGWKAGGAGASIQEVSGNALVYEGKYAVQVLKTHKADHVYQKIRLERGKFYNFSAYAKLAEGASGEARIFLDFGAGDFQGHSKQYEMLNGQGVSITQSGWTKLKGIPFVYTGEREFVEPNLLIQVISGMESFYVDNVSEGGTGVDEVVEVKRPDIIPLPKEPVILEGIGGSIAKAEMYVSPNGDDDNDGSLERPFKTIERAKQEVNKIKESIDGDIHVIMRGGEYLLDKPQKFSLEDSAINENRIIYKDYKGENPIIHSYKKIDNFTKTNDLPEEIDEAVRDKIYVADVEKGWQFKTLYQNDTRMPRARSGKFNPVNKSTTGWSTGDNEPHKTMIVPDEFVYNWENLNDVELFGRTTAGWTFNSLPVASLDMQTKELKTTIPAEYVLGSLIVFPDPSGTVWFENAPLYIKNPGEWALDSKKGKLYFYPLDENNLLVKVPTLTNLISVEGEVDLQGSVDNPIKGIYFDGITFTGTERITYPEDYRGKELQHAWDLHDFNNAAVRFRSTEDCGVVNSKIYNVGFNAIRFDLHARYNLVSGNTIQNAGGGAVLLAGYGPGTKDVNEYNNVVNNLITDCASIKLDSPAIFAWQSSRNHIAYNRIDNVSGAAITASGRIFFTKDPNAAYREAAGTIRWHEIDIPEEELPMPMRDHTFERRLPYLHGAENYIEYNHISRSAEKMADVNAIYISGQALHNVVRRNFIHDCLGEHFVSAIRTDGDTYDQFIVQNIMTRIGVGGGIASGQRNVYTDNIIVDMLKGKNNFGWGYIAVQKGPTEGSVHERNIAYAKNKGQSPLTANTGNAQSPAILEKSYTNNNVYYNEAVGDWANAHIEAKSMQGIEANSVNANPKFHDIDNEDFRLRADSPALKLGFEQFYHGDIGLTHSFVFDTDTDKDKDMKKLFVRSGDEVSVIKMDIGEKRTISARGKNENSYTVPIAANGFAFYSSNINVATVSPLGVVTGAGSGNATIYVMAAVNGKSILKSIDVSVSENKKDIHRIPEHWASAYLERLYYTNNFSFDLSTFNPNQVMTRADATVLLMSAFDVENVKLGKSKLKDITPYRWYSKAINAAQRLGYIPKEMIMDDKFNPDAKISKNEFLKMCIKAHYTNNSNDFDYMGLAQKMGIISKDSVLDKELTQAEAMTILSKSSMVLGGK